MQGVELMDGIHLKNDYYCTLWCFKHFVTKMYGIFIISTYTHPIPVMIYDGTKLNLNAHQTYMFTVYLQICTDRYTLESN